jgi:hypothetical protein
MNQSIDFIKQVDLENFLGYLQQLITDCALFIVDQSNSAIIYEFKSTRFNPSIAQLTKQKILNNLLETGKIHLQSATASIELLCHQHNIQVSDQDFSGKLYLVQPLQQAETSKKKIVVRVCLKHFIANLLKCNVCFQLLNVWQLQNFQS